MPKTGAGASQLIITFAQNRNLLLSHKMGFVHAVDVYYKDASLWAWVCRAVLLQRLFQIALKADILAF